jgi:hypothetical protein
LLGYLEIQENFDLFKQFYQADVSCHFM